jgi:hypothetical protein
MQPSGALWICPAEGPWAAVSAPVQASVSAGFFARLGCTRIGSPGIVGERDTKALFKAA